ncbi:DUF4388 domain-containing protein [Allocoleopsis franciscana]|uniref:PatA-like N-terminal domain-containing protein n=1 Tax=Allocoleopsis franciscana PCC 7113 TaxID=1173027 RepID=K9WFZ2_9CYAN|nr:DUF4388 domain-containing protein [Allocoleopsis franciscana]AFZ19103.1 hypothetical protein Mic7113_3371 [Allocoleopsis franciscana PCC 7113]
MSITGALTDFSLPEIFQFVEKGHKTGLLTLRVLPESTTRSSVHYLWMNQGRIVAAANQLNGQGLISLIHQYPWVSQRVVTKLAQFCPANKPLGLYLRSQGALQVEHIEHLFQVQIIQQICAVFQLKDAHFVFDQNVPAPMEEMTGLSVSSAVLVAVLRKLVILKGIFESRKFNLQENQKNRVYPDFCQQLELILNTAFFHSLNISLFDPDNSLNKLYQVLDLSERPYDLPKSIKPQRMCCTSQ